MFAGGAVTLLSILPLLIAQWIGVLGLAKCGRSGEWWCMLIGTALTSLSTALQIANLVFMGFLSSGGPSDLMMVYMAVGGISLLGGLLFMVGFAMHGHRSSRIRSRITELEMMNLAQATELERLRNR